MRIPLLILILLLSLAAHAGQPWGLMLHDDGDSLFVLQRGGYSQNCQWTPTEAKQEQPAIHRQYIECRYRAYADLGIDTLKLNVYSGAPYFEPGAADAPPRGPAGPRGDALAERMRFANVLYSPRAAYDPIEVALSSFRARGGKTVVSFRISDSHYLQAAGTQSGPHPLMPRILLSDPGLVIGSAHLPEGADPRFGGLPDFARPEVRENFIRVVQAALQRYGDRLDGLEIDFTRNPYLFRAGEAARYASSITGMLATIRGAAGKYNGGRLALMVRIPIDLERNARLGLDVARWMERKLVDVVIPSDLMTTDTDPSIEPLVALARRHDVAVYFGMPGRRSTTISRFDPDTHALQATSPGTRLTPDCEARCVRRRILGYMLPSPDYLLGAALNARKKGADGVELYNFASESFRASPWFAEVIRELKGAVPARAVTFSGVRNGKFSRSTESSDPAAAPLLLTGDSPVTFRILVNRDKVTPRSAVLRLGLLDRRHPQCKAAEHAMALPLDATARAAYTNQELTGKETVPRSASRSIAAYFPEVVLLFRVDEASIREGYNSFSITCPTDNILMDAELTLIP